MKCNYLYSFDWQGKISKCRGEAEKYYEVDMGLGRKLVLIRCDKHKVMIFKEISEKEAKLLNILEERDERVDS